MRKLEETSYLAELNFAAIQVSKCTKKVTDTTGEDGRNLQTKVTKANYPLTEDLVVMNNRSDILLKYHCEFKDPDAGGNSEMGKCKRAIVYFRNGDVYSGFAHTHAIAPVACGESGLADSTEASSFFAKVDLPLDKANEGLRQVARKALDLLEAEHGDLDTLTPKEREANRYSKIASYQLANLLGNKSLDFVCHRVKTNHTPSPHTPPLDLGAVAKPTLH